MLKSVDPYRGTARVALHEIIDEELFYIKWQQAAAHRRRRGAVWVDSPFKIIAKIK